MTTAVDSVVPVSVATLVSRPRHESRNVALDLETEEHLVAADRDRAWWRANGRSGTQRVKCLGCLDDGLDHPWLTYAHGSKQVPHLRHIRVAGSSGETRHSPESSWHLQGKRVVENWASAQASVLKAVQESRVTDSGVHRRADVLVTCHDARSAFELQYSALTADLWAERHADYRAAGTDSIWLYDAHVAPNLEGEMSGRNCFIFDPDEEMVGILLSDPAPRTGPWWNLDPKLFSKHVAGPWEDYQWVLFLPLQEFAINGVGAFVFPEHPGLDPDLVQIRAAMDKARREDSARDASFLPESSRLRPSDVLGNPVSTRAGGTGGGSPTLPRVAARADIVEWCDSRFPGRDSQVLAEEMSGLITVFEAHGMGLLETYRAVRIRRLSVYGRSGLPAVHL